MGASEFYTVSDGNSAREAFDNAIREARYDCGNQGYSGTISEKSDFVIIKKTNNLTIQEYAELLINDDDERISDKWGPAGCLIIEEPKQNTAFPIRTKVEQNIVKGAKIWDTFYVGYSYKDEECNFPACSPIPKEVFAVSFKDEAMIQARDIALRDNSKVDIILEKRLRNCEAICASITVVPVKNNGMIGKYLFFGLASS